MRRRPRLAHDVGRNRTAPHGERERRAAAGFALHIDLAAHQRHQLPRDDQSQPGAAVLAVRGTVRLDERPEQLLQRLGRDADAGIPHLEAQVDFPGADDFGAHRQADRTPLRELDRIAGQVVDHLAKPVRIAQHALRYRTVDLGQEDQARGGRAHPQHRDRLLDEHARVVDGALQAQLAGLDLREVEDVVDQAQQRLAAGAADVEVPSLLHRQLGVEQQGGHADHAVHGRADLVRHVGQEFALGGAGLLGTHGQLAGLRRGLLEPAVALEQVGRALPHLPLRLHLPAPQEGHEHHEQHAERAAPHRHDHRLPLRVSGP
jgi:hypothetical protein